MAGLPPQRTFSFEQNDERVFQDGRRMHESQHPQPYRDHDGIAPNIPTSSSPQPPAYAYSTPLPPTEDLLPPPPPPPAHRVLHSNSNSSNSLRQPPSEGEYSARFRPPAPIEDDGRFWGSEVGYSNSNRTGSSATPGVDNLGETAPGGGIAGIALGVASSNERESGLEAVRAIDGMAHNGRPMTSRAMPSERDDRGLEPDPYSSPYPASSPHPSTRALQNRTSYSSTVPLGAAAGAPGQSSPGPAPSQSSLLSYPSADRYMTDSGANYADNPYNRYSTAWDPRVPQSALGGVNPNDIEDDGDDGLGPAETQRRSVLNLGRSSTQHLSPAGAAAGGAATGGMLGSFGGMIGKRVSSMGEPRTASGHYGPVPPVVSNSAFTNDSDAEKSEWLARQSTGKKKMRWIVGILIAVLLVAAIAGGVVGGILGSKNNPDKQAIPNSSSNGESAAIDDGRGDLTSNSKEIKQLLGNPNLHKVFPGVDYTPFNAQYPACLTNPPSQNNVTRDVAVLSQLTNKVRLYGTDCNQTEMVLHAIDALGLQDMKVWLGVWLGNNATTNTRQLRIMNKLLDKYGDKPFAGVIVGNEVLFRKDMTEAQLATVLEGVKTNLTSKGLDLPLATSDLGDNWTGVLAAEVDIIMSNVHPFFAGVKVDAAAGWTWDFWQTHDVILTNQVANKPKNIISEVGWPSGGGTDCGGGTCASPASGSVAGIQEMNQFMDDFVCQSMKNGTEYFWFEAFDEPWKKQFNTAGKNWEDKWGLMDIDRKLKEGVKIPDCGGKTVS